MSVLHVIDLGLAAYAPTLELQKKLLAAVQAGRTADGHLILVEHSPPVITLGRRGKAADILAPAKKLAALGVKVHEISRGGLATYHGPGQLVAYPILRLDVHGMTVKGYVGLLENAVIATLQKFGIAASGSADGRGVWAGDDKIAAVGVAVSRWVTYHGLALNVSTNLSHFDLIVPCGLADKGVTSMEKLLGRPVDMPAVKSALAESLRRELEFDSLTVKDR